MSLQIASINSGSNGNCYYIGNGTDAVLVDAGISCREIEHRMKGLQLDIRTVKAIFVSHEHTDHIRGVSKLANKYSLPVYITTATAKNGPHLIRHLSKTFTADMPVDIFGLQVTAFTKQHDAADPHSFVIQWNAITVGVFTDIGVACNRVQHYFKQCHAVFLESNYDEEMLENGRYPFHLKNRIRNGQGHLSNRQALELFITHRPPQLQQVLLSHLSKENNTPELALNTFKPHAGQTTITVASRYEASGVFTVGHTAESIKKQPVQLGLFA
ncbi:MAG TPA: MBL fold metallo-hydrolase [Ferruginibacter sp.]|nr:MBL fold metallo-hydrolase [Ferruginibacter sp.]HMP21336.1 MBL fold metallo-hydrolase [Ferruginibacter sp.]